MTIDELNIGSVAYDNIETYARVAVCVHGYKYYAAYDMDDNDNTPYYIVSDMDNNHIPCCS